LHAFGRRERDNFVQATGVVRLVGSSPLTELIISGPDREWYVSRDDEYKLRDLQHQTVTVEGVETVITLRFANGFPAGERFTLDRIKVISVHE
jgi:hypothetical protein